MPNNENPPHLPPMGHDGRRSKNWSRTAEVKAQQEALPNAPKMDFHGE